MSTTRYGFRKAPATDPAPDGRAALLLIGHGSPGHLNAAAPLARHAAELRRRGGFAEVRVGLLNGQPGIDGALDGLAPPRVYVVPALIGDSDLVRRRLPERLGLSGPLTRGSDDRLVCYCRPLGASPKLADAIADHVARLCAANAVDPSHAALLLVGHGTPRDAGWGETTRLQAQWVDASRRFAEVGWAFLEEPPAPAQALRDLSADWVVVCGLFLGGGKHVSADLAAIRRSAASTAPKRRILDGGVVGALPAIADIILAQVRAFDAEPPPPAP